MLFSPRFLLNIVKQQTEYVVIYTFGPFSDLYVVHNILRNVKVVKTYIVRELSCEARDRVAVVTTITSKSCTVISYNGASRRFCNWTMLYT